MVDADSREARAKAVLAAYKQAKAKYDSLKEKVVVPQFKKYDEDGSGAIDKQELSKLCKDLGQPLDDSQLDSAIKDLDINKDGVIDLQEFCSWWFSGFQSYSTRKRTMLKIKGQSKSAFQALVNGDTESIIGSQDQLKQIKHTLSLSFNKPEKAGSSVSVEIHPGGKTSTRIYNELHNRFKNTSKFNMKEYAQENECSVNDSFDIYVQVKIKMKKGVDKKQFGQRIEDVFKELQDKDNTSKAAWLKKTDIWSVKCKTEGDYLCIGKHILIPHKYINDKTDFFGEDYSENGVEWYFDAVDIIEQISEIDQSLKVELDLGATARDAINAKTNPYDTICKGVSFTTSLELIRNLKKIIFGLLSDKEKETQESELPKGLKKIFMGLSPLVLLKMNANIKLTHDNIQELKECFEKNDKFKSMVATMHESANKGGPDIERLRAKKFDASRFKAEDLKQYESCYEAYFKTLLANLALDIFNNMSDLGDIQLSAALPKLGAVLFKVKSEGLSEMLKKLWAHLTETEVKIKYEEWCPEELDNKSPLGKPGNFKRILRTVNDSGTSEEESGEGITHLYFEPDGYFSCLTDYSESGNLDESTELNQYYAKKCFGAWNNGNKQFKEPDTNLWKMWEKDHTVYWAERQTDYECTYYYSGKFVDGKIIGRYQSEVEPENRGTFTIQIESQDKKQDEDEEESENVRDNLLLEYFPLHGRAISIRLLLHLCEVDYEDCHLNQENFEYDKEKYPYGQVPVLTLKDGTQLAQSDSILRYLGKTFEHDGESLYSGASDPELSYKTDALMDDREDLISKMKFFYTMKLGSEQYQDEFAKFLTQNFPAWLQKLEDTLRQNKQTYLLRSTISLADVSAAGLFIAFPYNPKFELCHILQCVVEKYPLVKKYAQTLLKDFKPWMAKYSLPQPNIDSDKKQLSYQEIIEEIKKKDFGSLKLMSNYRNEQFLQKLIGFTPDKIPYKNEEIPSSKIQVKFADGKGAENLLNNDNFQQWTCENFNQAADTKIKFTFSEPKQVHFYSFTTAFLDKLNKEAKYCPTSWKVILKDHKTKEEYSETHYSFMHKFGTKDQKKYLSLTKERFQFLKLVTTSEVTFVFLTSSSRESQPDEDIHLKFEEEEQQIAKVSKAYQTKQTKAEGEIEDGEGEYEGEESYKLTGTFKNGVLQGQGTEYFEDEHYYEGNFENGYREGEGKFCCNLLQGSNTYEGNWKQGKMHGQGSLNMYHTDYGTIKYTGEFVDGKFHGEGEISWQDYTFTGPFKDGKQNGVGTFSESSYYSTQTKEGEWKDGKRLHFFEDEANGEKKIDPNTVLEDAVSKKIQINRLQFFGPKGVPDKEDNPKRIKESQEYEDDGTENALGTYDGEWGHGWGNTKIRDGYGTQKWENGKFFEGLWSIDKFVKGKCHKPEENYGYKQDYEGEFKGFELGGYGKLSYSNWIYYGYCTGDAQTEKFGTTFTGTDVVISEIKDNYYNGKGVYFAEHDDYNVAYVGNYNYGNWDGLGYASQSDDFVVICNWSSGSCSDLAITAYSNGNIVIGKIQASYLLEYDIVHVDYCIKYDAETGSISQANSINAGLHGLGIITDKNGVKRKAFWEDGEFIQYIDDGDMNTMIRCLWQTGTCFDAKYLDPANFNDQFMPEKDDSGNCCFENYLFDLCELLQIKTVAE